MENITFTSEEERITARNAQGQTVGEITFPVTDNTANINHTYIAPELRGQGLAGRLVKAAAEQVLARGYRLTATCSYAVTWLQRHPEYPTAQTDAPMACDIHARH